MRRRAAGFTLIEALVAMTVLAVFLGYALLSLNLGARDTELETEVSRFVAIMEVARDETLLQGREFGIEFLQQGYRFVELDPFTRQWLPIAGDDFLGARDLPERVEFELYLEGQQIELDYVATALEAIDDDDEDADEQERLREFRPHVFVMSSGDLTPFELVAIDIETGDRRILEANLLGEITIVDEDFEP